MRLLSLQSMTDAISFKRRKPMELMNDKPLFRKMIFEFLAELDAWGGPKGGYLVLTDTFGIVDLSSFEGFKLNARTDRLSSPCFEFYVAKEDESYNLVLTETFLAKYFDVEVDDLLLDNLENFRIIYNKGNAHVLAIINHPKDFLGEIAKLMLFCNIYT